MKRLEIDPLRAIPADDEPVPGEKSEKVVAPKGNEEATDVVSEGNEEATETEIEAEGENEDHPDGEEEDPGFTAEDIEAVLAEDSKWIPKGRFDEVNEGYKRVAAQAQTLEQRLAQIEAERKKADEPKPRDFNAELKAAKEAFESGDLSSDEYEAKRDELIEARHEAKLEAKLAERLDPLAKAVKQREEQAALAELQAQLNTVAAKAFVKYPFLDGSSDEKDDEAIAAVKKQRAELEADGLHPAKALALAVQIVAPAYAPPEGGDTPGVDPAEIARQRKLKARKALIEATESIPPNIGRTGVGTKVTDNKVQIGRGVEDHERWLNIPEQERDKRIVAIG